MYCAYRCTWDEKEIGRLPKLDNASYCSSEVVLTHYINSRRTSFESTVEYIPGKVELVVITEDLSRKIAKAPHMLFHTESGLDKGEIETLAEHNRKLRLRHSIIKNTVAA